MILRTTATGAGPTPFFYADASSASLHGSRWTTAPMTVPLEAWMATSSAGLIEEPERENGTAPPTRGLDVVSKSLAGLFNRARGMIFEDGLISDVSEELAAICMARGPVAIEALTNLVVNGDQRPAVIAEALRCIGRLTDPTTHASRRWLLLRCLESKSIRVRGAAVLALCFLKDRRTITDLNRAAMKEADSELRVDIEQAIAYLEVETRAAIAKEGPEGQVVRA